MLPRSLTDWRVSAADAARYVSPAQRRPWKLYPITAEDITKHVVGSKSIYKQHILHALIEYGYSNHFYGKLDDELFNEKTGSCIVEREYPDINYVLDLIHSARGAAVMAHPVVYDSLELLDDLAKEGKIDGVEVFHYSANEEQQATLLAHPRAFVPERSKLISKTVSSTRFAS